MSRLRISQLELKDAISFQSSPIPPPYASFPYSSPKDSPSSSTTKISPIVLLVIVILAIIFFLSGLLHLLIRYLMKRPYSPSLSFPQSNRYHPDNNNNNNNSGTSDALQRQLQQLFRLHDSGLDQAVVDSLPVFYYKDIVGIKKEGFDCAVCLCEFSTQDKLRLLPLCSHAFHISCIDTWLLSNSTCPLCRGSLVGSSGYPFDGVGFDYYLADLSNGCLSGGDGVGDENGQSFRYKPSLMEESASERRVFSVRLGKFRSLNNVGAGGGGGDSGCRKREELHGETSSSSSHVVDARRCYSLGTYQYVLGESNLLVAASSDESIGGGGGPGGSGRNIGGGIKVEKVREDSSGNNNNHHNGLVVDGGDVFEGKKISRRHRGDSFSVSKIWMWSKKDRFPSCQVTTNMDGGPRHLNVGLPLTNRVQTLPL